MASETLLDPLVGDALPSAWSLKPIVGIAACGCIVGGAGLLGGMGVGCPAHSPLYDHKFLGGGLEGTFREVVGQLLMAPYFLAGTLRYFKIGRCGSACCHLAAIAATVAGQLLRRRASAAICGAALMLDVVVRRAAALETAPEHAARAVVDRKVLAILGGLFALVGRQLFEVPAATYAVAFWVTMFGRFLLMLPFLEAAAYFRSQDFQRMADDTGFPAAHCLGRLGYAIAILGPVMNFIGSTMSSFACHLTFLKIRVACWIAIPGSELLLLSLTAVTLMDLATALAARRPEKRVDWTCVLHNAAIIGSLTNMTGSDVWYL